MIPVSDRLSSMMYKAFYKGGGHASVMEEIKLNEVFFFANPFLRFFF